MYIYIYIYIYIFIYNIMENIQRTSALQYIFSILFKTFDSCVYVTEVSFSLVFKLRSLSRCMSERARRKCSQQKLVHIPEEKELAKTYAPNCEDRFYKSQYSTQRYKLSVHCTALLSQVCALVGRNDCRKLFIIIIETLSHAKNRYT